MRTSFYSLEDLDGFGWLLAYALSSAAFGLVARNLCCFLLDNRPLALSLLKASLVTLIAAGGVNSLLHAIMASATPFYNCRRAFAHILKRYPWYCTYFYKWNWSPFIFLEGIIWGLWIAGFAKYSPDLWGQRCQVSAFYAWRGVRFLLLRAVCNGNACDGDVGHGSLRTSFWGTQWGQLNQSLTLLSLLALIEWWLGSLRRLLAW